MGFFSDLFSGNFTAVEHDVSASVAKLPSWAQKMVTTLETNEGQILSGLAETAAIDLVSKGLTTANFTATAKDIESKLVSQEINLGTQTVYAALNGAVAALPAPSASVPADSAEEQAVGVTDTPSAVEAPSASTSVG